MADESAVAALAEELKALREKIEGLETRQPPLPEAEASIEKFKLLPNEERVLRLIALGLSDGEAASFSNLNKSYVNERLHASIQFAAAYKEISEQYEHWIDARLRFVMPRIWQNIDDLLEKKAEDYIPLGEGMSRAVLQAQTRVYEKVLDLVYAREKKIVHEHTISQPMLQIAEKNLDLIAQRMQSLAVARQTGMLDSMLPENQIIDIGVDEYKPIFADQPQNAEGYYKCLECDAWVEDLVFHLHNDHDMSLSRYQTKHSIQPGVLFDDA